MASSSSSAKRSSVVKDNASTDNTKSATTVSKTDKETEDLSKKTQALAISDASTAVAVKDANKEKGKTESKELVAADMSILSDWQYVYMCLHTLMWHVNQQTKTFPEIKSMEDLNKANPKDRVKLCSMLFEELATYVGSFLNTHANFPFASQLMSWAHAVPGDFVLVKITAVGAIFVDERTHKVYLVKALHDSFQTLLERGKKEAGSARFRTTLIPFNRQITYNTLLVSLKDPTGSDAQVLKDTCEKAYEQAKEAKSIIKHLEPVASSGATMMDEADANAMTAGGAASHGHSHNGVPCHGHGGHGGFDPSKLTPEQLQMLIRQRQAQLMAAQQQQAAGGGGHTHSHGGVPCGGHGGHGGQHNHSHSHGGGVGASADHGHSHAGGDHGHSHSGGDHGHSHAGGDHSHSHADHGHSHDDSHAHSHGDHGHSHSHGGAAHARSASMVATPTSQLTTSSNTTSSTATNTAPASSTKSSTAKQGASATGSGSKSEAKQDNSKSGKSNKKSN